MPGWPGGWPPAWPLRRRGDGRQRRPAPAPEVAWADVPARQAKMLGSLPVIASFCTRLGIGQVIDDLVPIRPVASLTVGQAVEAMICNRLTSPAPLVHVADWARDWAVPEILGIPALALNDTKLRSGPGRSGDRASYRCRRSTG